MSLVRSAAVALAVEWLAGCAEERILYDGYHATASASIVAAHDPKAAMKMLYELRRVDAGWEVVQAGTGAHAAGPDAIEPGAPPELPPGHPPLEPQPDALPSGHPPIGGGE